MVTLKAILLTPLEQVPWKAKIFRVDVQQGLENYFLSSSTRDGSYGLWDAVFWPIRQKFNAAGRLEFFYSK